MAAISEIVIVKSSIANAFKVITDFAAYPKFLKDISDVTVLKSTKTSAQVELHLNLIKSIRYSLNFKLKSPNRVSWELLDGDMFKKNSGSWVLTPLEPKLTEAIYTLDVEFGLFVPSMISKLLIAKSLPSTLAAFKKRMEAK